MWMLRQMEYDADRYEARLVGSDAFASTTARMRVLSAAAMRATAVLSEAYKVRRLADDFVALTAASGPAGARGACARGVGRPHLPGAGGHP
jgi:Zn-dependent protease with chaperone function